MKELAINHKSNNAAPIPDRHFSEALTRWNYFPNQKANASELPPCITTRRFTPEVCKELLKEDILTGDIKKARGTKGFDLIEYKMTRYNNVPRTLGLVHPLAYSRIFEVLETNALSVQTAIDDQNSSIKVDFHSDGRIFIMNYEGSEKKSADAAEFSFGKRFRAHTDIANCFGSIYSHSLEWAIQGFESAKNSLGKKAPLHWSSGLDQAIRRARRNETVGLPIGPATSSIAVEMILAPVDKALRTKGFDFTRYVDDYTCLTETHEKAQEFIRILGSELSKYKLNISLAKTSIVELPMPLQDAWVSRLMSVAPDLLNDDGSAAELRAHEVYLFLDNAVRLNNETPDGSVLRYALGAICHQVKGRTAVLTLQYALNLCWHYPALLPYLEKIDAPVEELDKESIAKKLNDILIVSAINRRSDGMCWSLYYLKQLNQSPSEDAVSKVIESKDCLSITMLCGFEHGTKRALEYAKGLDIDLYTLDQNWLLFYVLYYADLMENPYSEDKTFEILKKYKVDFFCNVDDFSQAEMYCEYLSNPFFPILNQLKTFDQFMLDKNPSP